MTPDALHALESAAFDAWPGVDETTLHGWRVRWADGYTKRANSANAIAQIDELDPAVIADIESFFQSRRTVPIFRLASFCTGTKVDERLASRGYRFGDLSLVMARSLVTGELGLQTRDDRTAARSSVRPDVQTDPAGWLAAYQAISGQGETPPPAHLRILQSIRGECRFLVTREAAEPVCCGLGVLSHGRLGLFEIATRADRRRAGLAESLCTELLRWGRSRGAGQAYLQVVAGNVNAIHLYERLGFRRAYHYWYRIGTASAPV